MTIRQGLLLSSVLLLAATGSRVTAQELFVPLQVSPTSINLASPGETITVRAEVPIAGYLDATLQINGTPVWTARSETTGSFTARFTVAEVSRLLTPPQVTVTMVGQLQTLEGPLLLIGGTTSVPVVTRPRR